jgi:hypothetical protein
MCQRKRSDIMPDSRRVRRARKILFQHAPKEVLYCRRCKQHFAKDEFNDFWKLCNVCFDTLWRRWHDAMGGKDE